MSDPRFRLGRDLDKEDRNLIKLMLGGGAVALVLTVAFYGALIYFTVWAVKQIWGG